MLVELFNLLNERPDAIETYVANSKAMKEKYKEIRGLEDRIRVIQSQIQEIRGEIIKIAMEQAVITQTLNPHINQNLQKPEAEKE